jgi:hypothetical protein
MQGRKGIGRLRGDRRILIYLSPYPLPISHIPFYIEMSFINFLVSARLRGYGS